MILTLIVLCIIVLGLAIVAIPIAIVEIACWLVLIGIGAIFSLILDIIKSPFVLIKRLIYGGKK